MNQQDDQMMDEDITTLGQPLSDFLLQLEDYTPTIPDAVTTYYLRNSGLEPKDPRLVRLISIAAQKFISDIANDALQHCKMRSTNTTSHSGSKSKQGTKDRRYCLTMDDLTPALAEFGITIKKPQYYV
ncbi:transcription initiation factor TFIID subunit 10 [Diorhabda carinulata]|uniref:transcription initiation factor TFIID subunit 10 n=1 Tax=Diorhabda sublineata TaxID=1163346 RepID=UPI0024E0826A|nr:transcription initiation factor TFIID subunit 10 [Diorhabda sublineata]XP_057672902.1 transcription initiation factor TFIID subunit 10 [Diorhabda carinulata]